MVPLPTDDQSLGAALGAARVELSPLRSLAVIALGSRVFGGARPDSDLDLLVVCDDPAPFEDACRSLTSKLGFEVQPIWWTPRMTLKELAQPTSVFMRMALGAGMLVCGDVNWIPDALARPYLAPVAPAELRALRARRYPVDAASITGASWPAGRRGRWARWWLESCLRHAVDAWTTATEGTRSDPDLALALGRVSEALGVDPKDARELRRWAKGPATSHAAVAGRFIERVAVWLETDYPLPPTTCPETQVAM